MNKKVTWALLRKMAMVTFESSEGNMDRKTRIKKNKREQHDLFTKMTFKVMDNLSKRA